MVSEDWRYTMKSKTERLNERLIEKFRDEVNKKDFVCFKYLDVDGKSHWNAICSCMDWITVAVRSINTLGKLPKDIDLRTMHMLNLISYIDIIDESITTLHSVFNGTQKRQSPFDGDQSIFQGAETKDDNQYFKELRARFGAHPVNLKDKKSGERHFASWPHNSLDGHDLTVMLYSNMINGEDRQIHINKDDLMKFAAQRYEFLNNLTKLIQSQYKQFIEWCNKNPIQKVEDPIQQVDILLDEYKKRLDSQYIEDRLQVLKDLLPLKLDIEPLSEQEKKFKESMHKLVDEIFGYLQNARFDDSLVMDDIFSADSLYEKNNYSMGKLLSCLHNNRLDDPLLHHYFKVLQDLDKWGFNFEMGESRNLTLLKVYLMDEELKNDV
jgi:hypothetical protein